MVVFVLGSMGVARDVTAETALSVYTGTSYTRRSDLHVSQPNTGSGAVFSDVRWEAKPFEPAPHYGLKLNHFFERAPRWGMSLDFTHYKMYAKTGEVVAVNGTWNGAPVNTTAPLGERVQKFEISHGVNMLALNVVHRWMNRTSAAFPRGQWQPYVAGGKVMPYSTFV